MQNALLKFKLFSICYLQKQKKNDILKIIQSGVVSTQNPTPNQQKEIFLWI